MRQWQPIRLIPEPDGLVRLGTGAAGAVRTLAGGVVGSGEGGTIHWEVPWHRLEAPDRMETELRRELPPGHVLFDVLVRGLGYRQDCDEVALALLDGSHKYAVVHLTYSKETDPRWPDTDIMESAEALQERVNADRDDFAE